MIRFPALALLCAITLAGQEESVATTLVTLPAGQHIDVVLNDRTVLTGRLGNLRAFEFVLEPGIKDGQSRTLSFSDVKQVRTKMKGSDKLIVAGLVWGALTLISVLIGG